MQFFAYAMQLESLTFLHTIELKFQEVISEKLKKKYKKHATFYLEFSYIFPTF